MLCRQPWPKNKNLRKTSYAPSAVFLQVVKLLLRVMSCALNWESDAFISWQTDPPPTALLRAARLISAEEKLCIASYTTVRPLLRVRSLLARVLRRVGSNTGVCKERRAVWRHVCSTCTIELEKKEKLSGRVLSCAWEDADLCVCEGLADLHTCDTASRWGDVCV